jgi:endonuclease/exonuclease/phosphatase (EEP) superfamily protein YafD
MMHRFGARFVFGVACTAATLLAAALAVRFTIRDTITGPHLLFYATPWPVLAMLAALLAWYWYWGRRGGCVLPALFASAAVGALAGWWVQDWKWTPNPGRRGDLRIVQWNVDRPDWRLDDDMRWLAAQDADLITIAEREPRRRNLLARWQAGFPDYHLVLGAQEMLCLVRGEVLSVEKGVLLRGSYRSLIRTRVRGRDLTVLQVDIMASPPANRRIPWQTLTALAETLRAEPLLIAGDFNTPLETAYAPALRAVAANAFETAGRGCAATWPMPLPVLSLDQMWTNRHLRAVRCEQVGSWRSDHRAVIAEFDFVH